METSRHRRTHTRLVECAMDLFDAQGFEQTTVAQIAAAAEVTPMTFFRHFASKELVVTTDPYDPAIVAGVAARPRDEPALVRAACGVRDVLGQLPPDEPALLRRRVRIIAASARLRASSRSTSHVTELAIGDQLLSDGTPELTARVAAAALLAALTAALFAWAQDEHLTLPAVIDQALSTLTERLPSPTDHPQPDTSTTARKHDD